MGERTSCFHATLLCLWLFRQKRVQIIGLGLLQIIWTYVLFSAWAFA